ncbi:MAG TPA: hypothetical protein VNE16_04185 [Vicinamibacterales bacterium]|nr:hypothetical protein [Vicinamibacterales bacterium]
MSRARLPGRRWAIGAWVVGLCLHSALAWAGPPFDTDDPDPVPLHHWEFYAASIGTHDADGTAATAPHVEINYGAFPGIQLHLITPFMDVMPTGAPGQYGYGDTEIGMKVRFIKETKRTPEIGMFPLAELPTGDSRRGLGNGLAQFYIPLWVQKSWGHWTSYGGGGFWRNPGPGNRNWRFLGWEVQRDVPKFGFLGAELFHTTASTVDGHSNLAFNIGGQLDFTHVHHLLFSAGRTLTGPAAEFWYIAYYVTL